MPFIFAIFEGWMQIIGLILGQCGWTIVGFLIKENGWMPGDEGYWAVCPVQFKLIPTGLGFIQVPDFWVNLMIAGFIFVIGGILLLVVLAMKSGFDKTIDGLKRIPSWGNVTPSPTKENNNLNYKIERTSYKPICDNCGASLKPTAKFCGKCGTPRA
jgi:ribosomal protein L40E